MPTDKNTQDHLPTGKIERAAQFLKTGARIGGNYVSHYTQKALLQKPTKGSLDRANAADLLAGMAQLRGTALKMLQMMSMDQVNFSEDFTQVIAQSQHGVPPMSAPMAIGVFRKTIGKDPEQVFDRFNPIAVRAASMGQVHEAWKDGKKLAVKIQYPGVADSVSSDLAVIKRIAPAFVKASAEELEPYFEEVEVRFREETDYVHELAASQAFARDCAEVPGVVFPTYYPEYSGNRVLTMDWLEGMHLQAFVATAPRDIVQQAAQTIWYLYDHQMHVLRRVNADPHPGNFLFFSDGTVGLIDFGCTKSITLEMYESYYRLVRPDVIENPTLLQDALQGLDILRPTDSPEQVERISSIFGRLVSLLTRPLRETPFRFRDPEFFRQVTLLSYEIKELGEVRGGKDFLFVNRTFLGLFLLMQQLDGVIDTQRHPAVRALLQPV